MAGDQGHLKRCKSHADENQKKCGHQSACSAPPLSKDERVELDWLRNKVCRLQKEWDSQQEHIGRIQGDLFRLRNQLHSQSAFCASLGSVMGQLVWKATRLEPVVNILLTTNKVSELLLMVSSTLVSFMETFNKEVPDMSCDETQFIMSMGGIVANLAAVSEGRHYIVSDQEGKKLINNIVKILPIVPNVSGDPVKRILLMILYNISINDIGMLMLQDQKPLLIGVAQAMMCDRTPELRMLALKLLESLTTHIASASVLQLIQANVPLCKLDSMFESGDVDMRHSISTIRENISRAGEELSNIPCYRNTLRQAKVSCD